MSGGVKAIILIILTAAAVYLAGNARVQLWDRDEPRYAQCSRQMLQSGDWVVPRLYDKLRFQKPPLIYWCQAAAMKVFGSEAGAGAFSARLPSVIAMLATLIVLAIVISKNQSALPPISLVAETGRLGSSVQIGNKYVGVEQAAWTVFILASSVMTLIAAKSCLTDSVLLLFITVAQLCFYAIWQGNRSWSVTILLAIMLGLGGLTKGPFILGIVGCTATALTIFYLVGKMFKRRSIEQRGFEVITAGMPVSSRADVARQVPDRPDMAPAGKCLPYGKILVGLAILSAIVIPWVLLVHYRAPDFLSAMFHEGKQHALAGKEGHNFPPGYHLLLIWPMFMPWSLLLPMAIGFGIKNRKVPQVRFALAAVLGSWLMVEFMGTKLPHYFLPAYPALAYLVAYAIRECLRASLPIAFPAESTEFNPRRRASIQTSDVVNSLSSVPFLIGATFWTVAIVCVGAAPWLAADSIHIGKFHIGAAFRPLPWDAMIGLTTLGVVFGIGVFLLFFRRKFAPAFVSMGIGMLATFGLVYTCYFPDADFLQISTHVAGVLQSVGATHPGDAKMVGYLEPSLAFYQGGTIREVEKRLDLVNKPLDHWPHWVVMSRDVWNMLSPESQRRLRIVDTCRGWAYSDGGRVVEVMVVENRLY